MQDKQRSKTLVLKGFLYGNNRSDFFLFMSYHVSDSHTESMRSLVQQRCRLISVVPKSRDKRKRICFNIKKICLIFISLFMFFKTLVPYILLEKHCIIFFQKITMFMKIQRALKIICNKEACINLSNSELCNLL